MPRAQSIIELQVAVDAQGPGTDSFGSLRSQYLGQMSAPMDDMWLAFADAAEQHLIFLEEDPVGLACVDDEGALLAFYVVPRHQHRAPDLLRDVLARLKVAWISVGTQDPCFHASALDVAASAEPHTLLYSQVRDPGIELEAGLELACRQDLTGIVEFQSEATGAPLEFLRAYGEARIQRNELFVVRRAGRLVATGELRQGEAQPGVAQLGFIVAQGERGRGLGSRLMGSLVRRSGGLGLGAYCSTTCANLGAQRAIERAGFSALHQLLRVSYAL